MIALGRLHGLAQPLMNDALFASADWLTATGETVVKLAHVVDKAGMSGGDFGGSRAQRLCGALSLAGFGRDAAKGGACGPVATVVAG